MDTILNMIPSLSNESKTILTPSASSIIGKIIANGYKSNATVTIVDSSTSTSTEESLDLFESYEGDVDITCPKFYTEKQLSDAINYVTQKTGDDAHSILTDLTEEEQAEYVKNYVDSLKASGEEVPEILKDFEETSIMIAPKNSEDDKVTETAPSPEEEYETNIEEINRDLIKNAINDAAKPWDPRIWRIDGYITAQTKQEGQDNPLTQKNFIAIVPFSTDTACSAFKDRKFTLKTSLANELAKSGTVGDASAIGPQMQVKDLPNGNDVITYIGKETDPERNDKDFYGLASLMNPYSVTLLAGGLAVNPTIIDGENSITFSGAAHPNLYVDIRDQRRFYDLSVVTKQQEDEMRDVLSVSNPTTTNIIKYSSRDYWGRTPYAFQDFVYCKWWNIIPNNRLITLRKYSTPCLDNLEFYGMYDENGNINSKDPNATFSPISTVVTYFGENTGNSLKELLRFTTGPKWGELESKIHEVSGTAGTNSMEIMDRMIHGRSMTTGTNWVDGFFNKGLYAVGDKYVGFSKLLNLLTTPNGYNPTTANINKLTSAQLDPYENGPLSNKIQGPVNVINKVMRREAGINFNHESLNIKCTYVAKEIGGINPKAAMLDILANCLMMGSVNAMFWGGGYRFDIKQNGYPWGLGSNGKSFLEKMARGKIFGSDGAINSALSGIKDSLTDSDGNFNFNTITSKLGNVFSTLFQGLGDVIEGGINKLFGTSIDLFKGPKAAAGSSAIKNAATNVKAHVENMFKNEIIQQTTYPSVTGMRALLTGEPVGNWHLMIGNPLNPIVVIGNLICEDVTFEFSEELGPDDFPVEMSATFKLKHGMARDSRAIQSMFNRGNGKIYDLPDYVSATSDQETTVDKFTGGTDFNVPSLISPTLYGATPGRSYKFAEPTEPINVGNPNTSIITKFVPYYKDTRASLYDASTNRRLSSTDYTNIAMVANYPVYMAHGIACKALL